MFGLKRGEERAKNLIANMFGSHGEGIINKTKLLFYPYNFTSDS
jgi:hypothetical protein